VRVVTIPGTGERFDLDRPGGAARWNRALNRRFGMENLARHPSGIVRAIERRRRARVAALAAREPFDRALDLGAEDGSLAAAWRPAGRFVLLLDLDPDALRRAGAPGVVADAARLPFAASSFDLVVLSAVLEHLVDPRAAVADAARVLRPGGRVVAYVPWDGAVVRLKRWAKRVGFRLGPLHDGLAPGHLRTFDGRSLRALFRACGFEARVRLDPLSLGYYAEARR
jgi:SAM-dependent methyltransferase